MGAVAFTREGSGSSVGYRESEKENSWWSKHSCTQNKPILLGLSGGGSCGLGKALGPRLLELEIQNPGLLEILPWFP